MKKIFSLLLVFVTILGLCACGGNKTDSVESIKDRACQEVKFSVMAKIASLDNYEDFTDITYNVNEIDENKYEITGKVTYCDKYDDSFTKKYDAIVTYDTATDTFDCKLDDIKIH